MPQRACGIEENGEKCGLNHNRMFHGTRVRYVNAWNLRTDNKTKQLWPDMVSQEVLLHMVTYTWQFGVTTDSVL